jgi:hypothetical protein
VVHRTASWSLPGVVLTAPPDPAEPAEPLELCVAITAGRLVMVTSERSGNDYAADSASSDTGDYTD